jgi:hypothetical protein
VLGADLADLLLYLDTAFLQRGEDVLVVDELAKDGERLVLGFLKG